MEREVGELDFQTVVLFEFLDTPGDEVAPRSNKIRKDFENERLCHLDLLRSLRHSILRSTREVSQKVLGAKERGVKALKLG
jgi:hypothetical protein